MSNGPQKKITRIGFLPPSNTKWMGGVNYYANLFHAIKQVDSKKYHLVLFLESNAEKEIIEHYKPFYDEIHTLQTLNQKSIKGIFSRIENLLLGTNYILESEILKYNVQLISHSQRVFNKISSIGWIPDFQHLHLRDMFTKIEIWRRNRSYKKLIANSSAVFVSSLDALKDLESFFPRYKQKGLILRFVSQPIEETRNIDESYLSLLKEKYELPDKYFFLPNQFWKHKNHITVFKAVELIHSRGESVNIVCTGRLNDYRSPKHAENMLNYIHNNNLEAHIKILGTIPYSDVFGIMKFSTAVINPSLFEGWSSTVEECKSIGKDMILSDLDIHKEQLPDAVFFNRYDPNDLARILLNYDTNRKVSKSSNLKERTMVYGETFLKQIELVLANN